MEGVNDGVKGALGLERKGGGVTDMCADMDTYTNWPLLVERGAGSVNSDP